MTIPARLADVDQSLLSLAGQAGDLLPALRKRLAKESGQPGTDAGQLATLRKAIRELERAVGLVRWQPSGEKTEITHAGGQLKKSHKYTSKKRGPKGEWIYTYPDKPGMQHDMFASPAPMPALGDTMARAAVQVATTQLNRKQALERAVLQLDQATFTIPKGIEGLSGKWELQRMSPTLAYFHRAGKDETAKNYKSPGEFFGVVHHILDQVPALRAAYVEPDPTRKSARPLLVLRKAKSGAKWVSAGKTDIHNNQVYRDQAGREAVRTHDGEGVLHTYLDNGDTVYTKKVFRVLGADDDVTTCELCGKENLKKTVILLDNETGTEFRYGSDCAARAMGWTQSEIERTAETAQNQREMEDRNVRLMAHPLTNEIRELEEQIASKRNPELSWRDDWAYQAWGRSEEGQTAKARIAELASQRQTAVEQEIRAEETRKFQQRLATQMPNTWRKRLWMQPRETMLQGIADKLDTENAKKVDSAAFKAPGGFKARYVSKLRVNGGALEALDHKGEWKPVDDQWADKVADAYKVPGPTAWAAVNHPIHNERPATAGPIAEQQPASNERSARSVKVKTKAGGDAGVQSMMFSQAARGGSGRFTTPGSRDHLHAHRQVYVRRRDAGEIAGTQQDWLDHLTEGWAEEKTGHKIELLREYRHTEAEARGMEDGPDLDKVKAKLERLRGQLGKLGHKV